eukprot:scaffold15648_cov130-Isochrysis_galbana.AAC.2
MCSVLVRSGLWLNLGRIQICVERSGARGALLRLPPPKSFRHPAPLRTGGRACTRRRFPCQAHFKARHHHPRPPPPPQSPPHQSRLFRVRYIGPTPVGPPAASSSSVSPSHTRGQCLPTRPCTRATCLCSIPKTDGISMYASTPMYEMGFCSRPTPGQGPTGI